MYQTSNEYKVAIKRSVIQYNIRGTVNDIPITKDDILKNSLYINNKCSSKNRVEIGSVYVGELNVVLLMDLDPYSLRGKEISFDCGVKIGNDYEWIPKGKFIIDDATKTASGISIKAYDNMSKTDIEFTEQIQGTAFEIAQFACQKCGLVLANDNFDEFTSIGSEVLILYPDNDIETIRDLLYWLAQAMVAFVTANYDGEIEFKPYTMNVVDTIDASHRFQGVQFADYVTYYSSVTLENAEDGTGVYAEISPLGGLHYDLGANPLLQYTDLEETAFSICLKLSEFQYVPFSISVVADPSYELGDVLSMPGGLGDANKKFCITQFTWKYNCEMSISGAGKNPKVKDVKSKTDKELARISRTKSEKDIIQYYSFTNTSDITILDTEIKTIVDIRYTALKKTMAIFLAEVLAEIETKVDGITYYDAEAEFLYYVDGVLLDRIPKETWRDGDHIKHLEYYISTQAGTLHHLEIKCRMTGGSAFIKMGAIKACLYGQNLVASDDFTGFIKINQKPTLIALEEIDIHAVNDSQTLTTHVPHTESLSETISAFSLVEMSVLGAIDTVTTTLDHSSKAIITETGDKLLTETGDVIYTEGD